MHRRRLATIALAATAVVGGAAARHRAIVPPEPVPIELDARRSFAVTDTAILTAFPFERVVDQIAARSGVKGASGSQLVRQMFDTQTAKPGFFDAAGPHCDDFLTDGAPSFNAFPRRCPTPEWALATAAFAAGEYFPSAILNRFDLAAADGSHCGQYRLVYVRKGQTSVDVVHLIFEAVLPNPHPEQGLSACRPVAQFWADLSNVDSMEERRARLERFFFDGLGELAPVIDPRHYAFGSGGGIRTRQQARVPSEPRMYQFHTRTDCTESGDCTLRLVPHVLPNLPWAPLFDAAIDTEQGRAFRADFIRQVPNLAINDVNLYFMDIPPAYLIVESHASDEVRAFVYDNPFNKSQSTEGGRAFHAAIQTELTRIGSSLTPENIIKRAETQNCAGCHALFGDIGGGVTFPQPRLSRHVLDQTLESGEGGPQSRFAVSQAMKDVFIPHRMRILREFLKTGKAPVHSNGTIGGGRAVQ